MEKELLFSAENISKSFYGTPALSGVSLRIHSGEVVGLIGENGAGKTTLLKIMIGVQPQSDGQMYMRGEAYQSKSHMEANRYGVSMVFQEQSLIVNLPVYQNIFFGHEALFRKHGFVQWKQCREEAKKALSEVGVEDIDPNVKVANLNFARRQMVEIAKAVYVAKMSGYEHCIILLDEPTSVLNESEVEILFRQIRHLTEQGHSVVFVSHRLNEVLTISDRIYVFKDGKGVCDVNAADVTEHILYQKMVGRSTSSSFYKIADQNPPQTEPVLEVRDLGLHGCFQNINFTVHRGEILGLAGVVGSGTEEICSLLCGDERPTSGKILLYGREIHMADPSLAMKKGILMIPKERLEEGVFLDSSLEKNIAMSCLKRISRGPFLRKEEQKKLALKWMERLRIKATGPEELTRLLSGGNQQKVVFARALASQCDLLILNHPTRGVDVGAKEEIYQLIRDIVNQGKAVILLGDTLDECIGLSSRILVLRDGLVTGEFEAPAGAKPDEVEVVSLML